MTATDRVVHVARMEKFMPAFISLVGRHFGGAQHEFVLFGDHRRYVTSEHPGVKLYKVQSTAWSKLKARIHLVIAMHRADKIVLHGLFVRSVTKLLWLMPWLLKKTYWVMWGDDLYRYKALSGRARYSFKEMVRRRVIRRIGHLITHIPGDVELARQWYGAAGRFHYCLMYPSNVYQEMATDQYRPSEPIAIQLGNSADPGNHHLEILERLATFTEQSFCVYVPLSYGSTSHAQKVIEVGSRLLGDKFKPLTEFMPIDEYRTFLARIDIAIFNHRRQQAMGNTISLLGLGKKVYLRRDVTPWSVFENLGVEVYDVDQLSLSLPEREVVERNRAIIREAYSEQQLISQLNAVFGE